MGVTIEVVDGTGNVKQCNVSSSALYDALAREIGLIEVGLNKWVNTHGEYYMLTRYGFKPYVFKIKS
jgi:hypothetical protein